MNFDRIIHNVTQHIRLNREEIVHLLPTTNYKNGFFMNWFQNQGGEGYEYHLLMIGMCLALLFTGSGAFSLDGLMEHRR